MSNSLNNNMKKSPCCCVSAIVLCILINKYAPIAVDARTLAAGFNSRRVVNGDEAFDDTFAWQVSVTASRDDENNRTESLVCGGSLISSTWILTAGQCVSDYTSFQIGLGSKLLNEPLQSFPAKSVILHPNYGVHYRNDIALLELPEQADYMENLEPVNLPSKSQADIDFVGCRSEVSGWGSTTDDGEESEILRWTALEVIKNVDCAKLYGSTVTENTLCAQGSRGQNICNGDFGGALVVWEVQGWTQIGIASFVQGCTSGNPSGYTRVSKYLNWILENTELK